MIGIVDYKAGNIASVVRALDFLSIPNFVSNSAKKLQRASRIIFPGVGAAGEAMENLRFGGLDVLLKDAARQEVPILGICLGTQIILEESEEDGGTKCLGLVPGITRSFDKNMIFDGAKLKVPHMGWNSVRKFYDHPIFDGVGAEDEFYFVHSFYPDPSAEDWKLGLTDYGIGFCSAIAKRNIVALQFHPEKSGRAGLTILHNFSRWTPQDGKGDRPC